MLKRTTIVSTRWDLKILEEIEKLVINKNFKNHSQAIRECTKVGMKVHNYQEMMKDPQKADEFRAKMQEMIANEEMLDWVQTLQPEQIDGFLMALQMEKDNRHKVSKFV